MIPRQKDGAPVACIIPPEGVPPTSYGAGTPKPATKVNAARLFLNWTLSREGQEVFLREAAGILALINGPLPDALDNKAMKAWFPKMEDYIDLQASMPAGWAIETRPISTGSDQGGHGKGRTTWAATPTLGTTTAAPILATSIPAAPIPAVIGAHTAGPQKDATPNIERRNALCLSGIRPRTVRGAKPRARRSWVPQAGRSYRQRSATFGVAATQAGRSRALT